MTVEQTIKELETDINYFKNIEFEELAKKFERDLNTIKGLVANN